MLSERASPACVFGSITAETGPFAVYLEESLAACRSLAILRQ